MNNHAEFEVRWWASMTPAFITACYFVFHWVEHRDDPSTLLAAIGTLAAAVVLTGIFLFPRDLRSKIAVTQESQPSQPSVQQDDEIEPIADSESELVEALETLETSLPPMVFAVRTKAEPPEDPNPWLEKGRALARGGHYRDALYCFSYVLQGDPTNQDALTAKGGCLLKMNRNDEALRAFMRAANVDGTSPLQKEGMVLFLKRLRAATEF